MTYKNTEAASSQLSTHPHCLYLSPPVTRFPRYAMMKVGCNNFEMQFPHEGSVSLMGILGKSQDSENNHRANACDAGMTQPLRKIIKQSQWGS